MWGLRSSYVAGLVAALRDVGDVMVQTAGSLLEVNITQLRHDSPQLFRPFNMPSSIMRVLAHRHLQLLFIEDRVLWSAS